MALAKETDESVTTSTEQQEHLIEPVTGYDLSEVNVAELLLKLRRLLQEAEAVCHVIIGEGGLKGEDQGDALTEDLGDMVADLVDMRDAVEEALAWRKQ